MEDFSGHFSSKDEEKKSGEKIRKKKRRLQNRNPQKKMFCQNRPQYRVFNNHFWAWLVFIIAYHEFRSLYYIPVTPELQPFWFVNLKIQRELQISNVEREGQD